MSFCHKFPITMINPADYMHLASVVRDEILRLRGSDQNRLEELAQELLTRRLSWYSENQSHLKIENEDVLNGAYQLFLNKLAITKDDAPVVSRNQRKLVLHSRNFCPTLEACKILNLDTRFVCRHLSEIPTTELLRQLHPQLRFTRNYDKLRPHTPYCEEMIILDES